MRILKQYEQRQRGCYYCADKKMVDEYGKKYTACPYSECPYKVLDKYESYDEFLESEDSKILVDQFFSTAADCYTLGRITRKPQRMFSDGDKRTTF